MTVGYNQGKVDIDNRAGEVCQNLKVSLFALASFATFLAAKQHADLVALGYTDAEATELQTNFGVLTQLVSVFNGTQAIPTPVNVMSFMTPFTGVN